MFEVEKPVWCIEDHYLPQREDFLYSEKVEDFDDETELLSMMHDYEEVISSGSGNHGEQVERKPLIDNRRNPQPKDRLYVVFFIFAFLGLASLLPWNFFITAKKYFDYKLRNTSLPSNVSYDDPDSATPDQVTFESYLAVVSNGFNLLFSIITVIIVKSVSVKTRILTSSVVMLIIFAATTVMVKINTDNWQDSFLLFTLIMAALMSGAQSVLNSSVLGLSAIFPPIYAQSAMNGQAAGGTFAAVVNILTHWVGGDATASAFVFFLIAIIATFLSIVAYLSLQFLGFAKHHMALQGALVLDTADIQNVNNNYHMLGDQHKNRFTFYWSILKKIWLYCLSVSIVFFVTLSIFPAVCSLIKTQDTQNKTWDKYFMLVVCFLLFNIGDFLGRLFTFVCKFPGNHRPIVLLVFTIIRVGFIPLLMLCNAQPRHHLPVVFESDTWPIVFILLMGLTNGYLGTLCFTFGPIHAGENEAEVAGIMLALAMTLGLALGSFFSILAVKII